MKRLGAAFSLVLVGILLHGDGLASAAESDGPKGANSATVGIRTATPQGGDDRGKYEFEIFPTGVLRDFVAVANYRDRPISVRLLARDATTVTGSSYAVQSSAEKPSDVGAWITLKKNVLRLPPKTEKIVPFEIGVPQDAQPGDHSGAILVSLLTEEPKPEGGTVVVDHRVGMRVALRVPGDLSPELAVTDLKVNWSGAASSGGTGAAAVAYTVRNTGNVVMRATQELKFSRALGLPASTAKLPVIDEILPGGTVDVTHIVPHVFGAGPMNATVTLKPEPIDEALAGQAEKVSETVSFSAWPWVLIAWLVLVLILLALAGRFVRRQRTQRKKAAHAADSKRSGSHAKKAKALTRTSAAVAASSAIVLLCGMPGSAEAADIPRWPADTSAKEGTAAQAFDILTSGGCPEPATNIVGFGFGQGFPKEGAVVIANVDAGVSQDAPFVAPLADSLNGLMALQPNPKRFKGTYKFVVSCIEPLDPYSSYGDYVVAIAFDKPGHWKVKAPLSTTLGPGAPDSEENAGSDNQGSKKQQDKEGGKARQSETASEQSDQDADAERAAAATGVVEPGSAAEASNDGGMTWWIPLGIGIALLIGIPIALRRSGLQPFKPNQ